MNLKLQTLRSLATLLLGTLSLYACDRGGDGSDAAPSSEPAPTALETAVTSPAIETVANAAEDPYIWLEEIKSEKADAWIEEQNAATVTRLSADPRFEALQQQFKTIFASDDRLPDFSQQLQNGGQIYELRTDAQHPRGQIMRTSLESYATGAAF